MKTQTEDSSKVLIVDDEPAVRTLLATIISDKYDCTTATCAEEALTFLEGEKFDLVISDINMGGMSGIQLIERVLAIAPETVVMLISGNQTIDSPIDAIRGGAFDYIKKPFDIDQVVVAVDRAIEHSRLLTSKRKHETQLEQLVHQRTERLNFLAYHDSLTGLPNRISFEDELSQALARSRNLAIVFLSLDRITGLRDTVGHKMADRLLIESTIRLKSLGGKVLHSARFDGDEFVLMLECDSSEQAEGFAGLIMGSFAAPFGIGEYKVFLPVSIGISMSPANSTEPATLLRNAAAALSHARKERGSTFQFYTDGIHEEAVKRLALENDLRTALEEDEFVLHYQPKVNMTSGKITGMEALVRWNHPSFGVVSPLDFIPLAEETGLIVPLGEWILRTACLQTKAWHDEGFHLSVAVNVSPAQFQQKDLAGKIIGIVEETGLDPKWLNLEITESSIMNDTDSAIAVLSCLRSTGITIAIDDFGTGQSSLGHLKKLPIDIVKIDKSFVDEVATNPDDAALVMAVVTLAHNLRLKVVVEGVETEDQLGLLRLMGSDEWQGYLFSKPLDAISFWRLLTHSGIKPQLPTKTPTPQTKRARRVLKQNRSVLAN